jgi:hypothetical protein
MYEMHPALFLKTRCDNSALYELCIISIQLVWIVDIYTCMFNTDSLITPTFYVDDVLQS